MANRLTKKEKGFIKDFVKTGNATKAVLKNYDTKNENTAGAIGSENLRKPKIQKAIKSIADQIPDSLLVEKHLELLRVPKITRTMKRGLITDIEESTDVQALKAGLDMAYKLKGSYEADKLQVEGSLSLKDLFVKSKENAE